MKHTIQLTVLLLVWASAAGLADGARASTFPTVPYQLVEGSTYQEGCFDPCECPIIEEQPMVGTFDLVFYPFAGPLWMVAVERLTFSVPTLGRQISGWGSYVRAGDLHDLRLDLVVGEDSPRSFDSGLVAGGDAYPAIDVTVSMNGLFCYDRVLHLRAEPLRPAPHLTLDGPQLAWSAMQEDTAYDVVCGDLAELRASTGDFGVAVLACLADDIQDTRLNENLTVEPGQAVWFLVRPRAGSFDSAAVGQAAPRDAPIAFSAFACP